MEDRTLLMSAKPLQNGFELDCYKILNELGRGGFGITYHAFDTSLDREVAIKEYLPASFAFRHEDYSVRPMTSEAADNFSWGLDSFLKEAKTLAKFNHRNIVRVHTVFELHNTAYMVMEYEHGESLASIYKQNQTVNMAFLGSVFFPIFDGLSNIHKQDFIHRDIKPSNIYIRQDGSPVLIDFGSARQSVQDETSELTSLVSQGYTPLEQYSADYGKQGPWTDIYSLASTIYQGITGTKPIDAVSRSACLIRSQPDRMQPLIAEEQPGFDQRFLDAVHQGLILQPESRPQTLQEWARNFGIQGSFSGDHQASNKNTDAAILANSGDQPIGTVTYSLSADTAFNTSTSTLGADSWTAPLNTAVAAPISDIVGDFVNQPKKGKAGLLIGGVVFAGLLIAGGVALFLPDIKATVNPNQSDSKAAQNAHKTEAQELTTNKVTSKESAITQPIVDASRVQAVPPLSEDDLFVRATASQKLQDYKSYLGAFPEGKFAELAKAEIQNLLLESGGEVVTAAKETITPVPQEISAATVISSQVATIVGNTQHANFPVSPLVFNSTPLTNPESGKQYTIEQLIDLSPGFSPIEGLDESAWKSAQCSDCHGWDKATLCEQGNRYIAGTDEMITRISHPHGGFFKSALKQWAETDCQ